MAVFERRFRCRGPVKEAICLTSQGDIGYIAETKQPAHGLGVDRSVPGKGQALFCMRFFLIKTNIYYESIENCAADCLLFNDNERLSTKKND